MEQEQHVVMPWELHALRWAEQHSAVPFGALQQQAGRFTGQGKVQLSEAPGSCHVLQCKWFSLCSEPSCKSLAFGAFSGSAPGTALPTCMEAVGAPTWSCSRGMAVLCLLQHSGNPWVLTGRSCGYCNNPA